MKRYITSTTIESELESAGYSKVLNRLKDNFEKQGQRCEINKSHRCLDILDENGFVISQVYPRNSGSVPKDRSYYRYVGPGNGDYVKFTRTGKLNRYTEVDPYTKFIAYTNDPQDSRREEGKDVLQ